MNEASAKKSQPGTWGAPVFERYPAESGGSPISVLSFRRWSPAKPASVRV